MERKYSVYKIISPSGRYYIGITKTKVRERWLSHIKRGRKRALEGKKHPFYDAITKYGADNMVVETLLSGLTLEEANAQEIRLIAVGGVATYNVAPGGSNGSVGGLTFWRQLDADPQARAAFIKKAADARKKVKSRPTDRRAILLQWMKENPRKAWKIQHRAIRLANKANKRTKRKPDTRTLKEKLMWKHRKDWATKRSVTKIWNERTPEQRKEVGKAISKASEKHWAKTTLEQRQQITKNARAAIDRTIQGPAASKGVKAWWDELRKDPAAYRNHIDNRTKTLIKNLKRQGVNIRTKKYEDL